MRNLLLLLSLSSVAYAANPTITALSVLNDPFTGASTLTHSQLAIKFTHANWTTVGGNAQLRIRTLTGTLGSCPSSGGTVFSYVTPPLLTPVDTTNVGGLQAGTAYTICPELSVDGGGTWYPSAVPLNITTLALPATHPQRPAAPVTFNTNYPDTTGYTVVNEATCTNWVSDFATAISARKTHGTVINLPAGVPCTQQITQYALPVDPDGQTFATSAVSTTNNTITLNAPPIEGNIIRLATTTYSNLPGSSSYTELVPPLVNGMPYRMHCYSSTVATGSTCADGIVQLYACPTLVDGTTPACTFTQGHLEILSDVGSGTNAYMTEPHTPNWIIVRTSTPDSQFDPEHSRIQGPVTTDGVTQDLWPGPPTAWASKMAQIQYPYSLIQDTRGLITLGCGDCSPARMLTNIRFVGVEFTHGPDPYEYVSADPEAWGEWIGIFQDSMNIIFDRCWWHSNDTPERQTLGFGWQGTNQAIVDSYFDGLNYFHGQLLGLAIAGSVGGTSATIAPGTAGFGAGKGTLATTASIAWTGAPTDANQHRAFLYFTMTGNQLDLAFPIGVTPTCTGITSPCHVVALAATPAGFYNSRTATPTFPTTATHDNYYVDPIVSASSSCTSATSLFSSINTAALSPPSTGASLDVGVRFTSDANQYLCGIRFFKSSLETATTHTLSFWSSTGTSLGSVTTSSETASGWQAPVMLGTPYALTAAAQYLVSVHTTAAAVVGTGQWQNGDYYNAAANLHVVGGYVDSNGSGNMTDAWPRFAAEANGYEGPYGGPVGFVDLSGIGTIAGLGNADIATTRVPFNGSSEGTNFLIAGVGPGPYIFSDNYVEGSGNLVHYDNSGGTYDPGRHDYTHYRDYWRMDPKRWFTGPYSDGNEYGHRHFCEWKDGNRISVIGNIFNGGVSDATPTQEPCEFSAKDGVTTSDVLIQSASFMHMPGGLLMGVQEATGGSPAFEPLPAARQWITNSVFWDVNGIRHTNGGFAKPLGWAIDAIGAEDSVIDHNSIFINLDSSTSGVPLIINLPDQPFEGLQITNNFLNIAGPSGGSGQYGFGWYDTGAALGDSCHSLGNGEPLLRCKAGTNLTFSRNVLASTNASVAQLQAAFPDYVAANYFQSAAPTNLGFFNANGWNFAAGGSSAVPDFHLKAQFRSGDPTVTSTSGHAADLRDVGADIDLLNSDQGKVTLVSASATGVGTASITVDQPDSGSCVLDYGTESAVMTFTRVSQACTPGPVTFNIAGLTTGGTYYFRYDGAVQQPTGQFRAR